MAPHYSTLTRSNTTPFLVQRIHHQRFKLGHGGLYILHLIIQSVTD